MQTFVAKLLYDLVGDNFCVCLHQLDPAADKMADPGAAISPLHTGSPCRKLIYPVCTGGKKQAKERVISRLRLGHTGWTIHYIYRIVWTWSECAQKIAANGVKCYSYSIMLDKGRVIIPCFPNWQHLVLELPGLNSPSNTAPRCFGARIVENVQRR